MLPLDSSVQAEYADGFVLDETKLNDTSPYDSNHNVLRAILNKEPEAEHGKMVRFSCFYKNRRHDVNWTTLPDNARPIRFRDMEADQVGGQITEVRVMKVRFGYQFTDEHGRNQQEVVEL